MQHHLWGSGVRVDIRSESQLISCNSNSNSISSKIVKIGSELDGCVDVSLIADHPTHVNDIAVYRYCGIVADIHISTKWVQCDRERACRSICGVSSLNRRSTPVNRKRQLSRAMQDNPEI